MDTKRIRPDPCDWQIIACANFLQCMACICYIASIFQEELYELAQLIELIADLVTLSVAGCMGAQVFHETKVPLAGAASAPPPVAIGTPVMGTPVAGAPISNEEMER